MGPVYTLNWPQENRLCAWFIPRGIRPSAFYSLMPAEGTFPLPAESWTSVLQDRYKLSGAQTEEAIGCLRRIGKYVSLVRDPFKQGFARKYAITVQGDTPPDVVTASWEIRVIPGFND